jgi:hypothetical protein
MPFSVVTAQANAVAGLASVAYDTLTLQIGADAGLAMDCPRRAASVQRRYR